MPPGKFSLGLRQYLRYVLRDLGKIHRSFNGESPKKKLPGDKKKERSDRIPQRAANGSHSNGGDSIIFGIDFERLLGRLSLGEQEVVEILLEGSCSLEAAGQMGGLSLTDIQRLTRILQSKIRPFGSD